MDGLTPSLSQFTNPFWSPYTGNRKRRHKSKEMSNSGCWRLFQWENRLTGAFDWSEHGRKRQTTMHNRHAGAQQTCIRKTHHTLSPAQKATLVLSGTKKTIIDSCNVYHSGLIRETKPPTHYVRHAMGLVPIQILFARRRCVPERVHQKLPRDSQ